MQKRKDLLSDENAAVAMIIMGVLILVLSIIIIPVFYRMASAVDTTNLDDDLRTMLTATDSITDQETSFDHTTDSYVELTYTPQSGSSSITNVSIYNDSTSVWVAVVSANYTYNSNASVTFNATVQDANTTILQVIYNANSLQSSYTPSLNATNDIISIGNSVMSLNPLAALVAVAGGIIGILLAVLSPKMFASAGI